MPRRALQVVRDRPVVLVAQAVLDDLRDDRRDAAELGVTEGVPGVGLGQKPSVRAPHPLGDHDGAVAEFLDRLFDPLEEPLLIEGHLREEDEVRCVTRLLGGEAAGRGDPACVAAHDLQHEDLGGSLGHGGDVEGGLTDGDGDILGDRAEARAVVGDREVVVDGLGDADAGEGVAHLLTQLGDLAGGVLRVVATVVEEVADVVRLEYLDQAFVLGTILLEARQLVACRPKGATRGVAQGGDGLRRFPAGIDQVLGERTDDPVAPGIDLADAVLVPARGLDDAAGAGVDDGGDPAGLGVKGILLRRFLGHRKLPPGRSLCAIV
ncbi:hypothetical protein BMS3Abin12_00015 [bacterium BMS3Abin12]|nr:hypothetical protein BMS3Abin12_00015 [bacterium BMS3Abin12]